MTNRFLINAVQFDERPSKPRDANCELTRHALLPQSRFRCNRNTRGHLDLAAIQWETMLAH